MTKGGGRSGRTRDDGDGTGGQWSIVPVYDFSLRCRCRCCFRRHRKFRPRSLNRRCMRPRGLRLLRRLLGSSRRLFRLLRHGLVDATRIKTGGAAVRTILRQKPARPVIPHGDRKAGETKSSANKFLVDENNECKGGMNSYPAHFVLIVVNKYKTHQAFSPTKNKMPY